MELVDESGFALRSLRADHGLSIRALPSGCNYAIERDGLLINQVLASPVAGGVHRVWLRAHGRGGDVRFVDVVGPRAASRFGAAPDRFVWSGGWAGIDFRCTCWLHPSGDAWFFHVEAKNAGHETVRCDAIMLQDVGLASRGHVRNNELFTSQYLDHSAIDHPDVGWMLMTRQNLPQMSEAHPWLLQGCFPAATGFTTDGFDFFGVEHRGDADPRALAMPSIGQRVRQYETGYVAIQSRVVEISPRATQAWTFFAQIVADHLDPSSAADAGHLNKVLAMRKDLAAALARSVELETPASARSVFQVCEPARADDLRPSEVERLFPADRRHEEVVDGRLQSFFHGADSRHVVLRAKELTTARPHGHILRAGRGLMPDDELMCTTCFAAGAFASQLTLGNSSLAKLVSGVRDPLGIVRSSGLRMFVRDGASSTWQLLGAPSAFEMALDECRWLYKRRDEMLTVSCRASEDHPALTFDVAVEGRPLEMLICGEVVAGPAEYEFRPRLTVDRARRRLAVQPDERSLLGQKQPKLTFHVVTSTPDTIDAIGGDELLFEDGQPRHLPYIALRTRATERIAFTILGTIDDAAHADRLCERYETHKPANRRDDRRDDDADDDAPRRFWNDITAGVRVRAGAGAERSRADVDAIQDALAWFARDAIVHLGTPRGLEQPNGGAWGVRDVCQGPVEFLLSYDHADVVEVILRRLFAQQYARRGDWPQWFMFPPFQQVQSSQAHGDVLIWPLKALCDYLEHANDGSILHERLAYTDERTLRPTAQRESVLEHVDRLIEGMRAQFLPGVALPRFGEGDWDDSLQPADPLLRERMVSAWTAELMYQTLRRYAAALAHFGQPDRAALAERLADGIEADFQRHLMPDGVVAGFAVFEGAPARPIEYLLHPSDARTGIRYRLIPMTRGILSGMFSREQAEHHLDLVREHLLFPDGARLMDRPTTYAGGRERTFRRSESAAFFGREVGLQYVHAHLRYAEALAAMGHADELWRALRVVNPIAVGEVVQNARPRQRNCYFSSSDAAFADRYEASRDYEKLRRAEVPVDGGWRIYSSGPGIYTSLIVRHLFGLRRRFGRVEIDPVLPRELDGVSCELSQWGRRVRYSFSMKHGSFAPRRMTVNRVPIEHAEHASRMSSRYRGGGFGLAQSALIALLDQPVNTVDLEL